MSPMSFMKPIKISSKSKLPPKSGAKKTSSAHSKKAPEKQKNIPSETVTQTETIYRKTNAKGIETVCREVACEGLATSGGYCRLHYIKNWKKIKQKELILQEKKLNQYIEELVVKYPDKYIEAIRQDLASDKDFAKVIYDLSLDEGVDEFEIEGGGSETSDLSIDTIKTDFEDDGDPF